MTFWPWQLHILIRHATVTKHKLTCSCQNETVPGTVESRNYIEVLTALAIVGPVHEACSATSLPDQICGSEQ